MGNGQTVLKACCEGHHATYRCQLNLDESIMDELLYFKGTDDEKIMKIVKDSKKCQALIDLKRYWYSYGDTTIQWHACDKCIKDNVKGYFTYVPEGWEVKVGTFTRTPQYEEIKL